MSEKKLYGKYKITEEERQKRIEAIGYAVASVGLEGFVLGEDELKLHQAYIDGDLTFEERKTITLQRYGLSG